MDTSDEQLLERSGDELKELCEALHTTKDANALRHVVARIKVVIVRIQNTIERLVEE